MTQAGTQLHFENHFTKIGCFDRSRKNPTTIMEKKCHYLYTETRTFLFTLEVK